MHTIDIYNIHTMPVSLYIHIYIYIYIYTYMHICIQYVLKFNIRGAIIRSMGALRGLPLEAMDGRVQRLKEPDKYIQQKKIIKDNTFI